jgi:hypothetical protein
MEISLQQGSNSIEASLPGEKEKYWGLHCNENPIYVFLFWE